MALTPGARVGLYEVLAQIGVGGMGEVYKATDTSLKRAVAIKVLPASFAEDADRITRFQREAEVLASLNHPNIAQIYGLERSGPTTALVMELVEGPTLAGRIARGAIPVDEALPIARQIAEALEAAHEQGIIHRDLKPANIKVRADGTVKVLDFGLAKAMAPAGAMSASHSMSATITTPAMTQAGMILGTAAYMSPEQAKGRVVDQRADIWAFGCVLFEMLTGRRAFPGEDVTDTLAAVIRAEPDWSALPADLPPTLGKYLRRCVQKDPRQRMQAIGDVRLALEGAFETAVAQAAILAPPSSRGTRLAWTVAVLAMGSLAAVAFVHLSEARPMEPLETRLEITTPPAPGSLSFSKLSPDGRKVVFSAVVEGKPSQLWLRPFESEAAQSLAGTANASFPFWSPDSQSLGFFASGKLMRLDLDGGSARALANAPNGVGGAWGPDDSIVFTPTATSPLYRVPATGPPVEVTHLNTPAEASHRFPDFLPDGRHFLFFVAGTTQVQGVYLGSLDTRDTRRLLESDSAAVFAAPDHVLFRREENLLAQRLDLKTFDITGDSFAVAAQVSGDSGFLGAIAVSTSETGLIAYRAPISDPHQLTWFDRAGRHTGTVGDVDAAPAGALTDVRVSPDGRTVARVRTINGDSDVWLIDTARGVMRRFTSDPAVDGAPVWAPDSNRIAFYSRRSGPQNLWLKRMDGGTEERLRESTENEVPTDWSRDGRFILFAKGQDLWALPLEGDRKPVVGVGLGSSLHPDAGRLSGGWRRGCESLPHGLLDLLRFDALVGVPIPVADLVHARHGRGPQQHERV